MTGEKLLSMTGVRAMFVRGKEIEPDENQVIRNPLPGSFCLQVLKK